MTDQNRNALLVGSLPFEDEAEAMRVALDRCGPVLTALPDGEIGERSEQYPKGDRSAWVQTIMDRCEADTANWTVVRATSRNADGFSVDYESGPRLKPKHRPKELAAHLDLGWSTFARQSYPQFLQARENAGRPDLKFQVGLPTAMGAVFGMMSPLNAFRYAPAFTERLAVEANEILDFADKGDIQFQLEVPGELAMAYRLPKPAVGLALRTVLGLAERIRPEAPFGVHLCFGDLNNKALIKTASLEKLVHFTNQLVRKWPSSHELNYIHVPLAEADEPPPLERVWYEPLGRLNVPRDCRLVAGFVHDKRTDDELDLILKIIEEIRGDSVDVAASCGLGRRDRGTAEHLLDATTRLAGR